MHKEKLTGMRNTVIKQMLQNLPWLKTISEHEFTLYRTMCDIDLLADELKFAEKNFEIFDMRNSLDGRLEFEELREVCKETGLIESERQWADLQNVFNKLVSRERDYLTVEEFYLLSSQRYEIFNLENFEFLFDDLCQGEEQDYDDGGQGQLDT